MKEMYTQLGSACVKIMKMCFPVCIQVKGLVDKRDGCIDGVQNKEECCEIIKYLCTE